MVRRMVGRPTRSGFRGRFLGEPEWVWVLLGVLALIPFGAGLTAWYQHRQSRAEHKRRLPENGSAAVSPVKDFLARIGPGAITFGTDEENNTHLRESHELWWETVRPVRKRPPVSGNPRARVPSR